LPPDTEPIRIGSLVVTPGDPRIVIDGRPVYLSRQELTLLEIFARNAERVITMAALARSMARARKPLTNTGVSVHVHRLRERLKSAGVLIRTLRGFGYVLEVVTESHSRPRSLRRAQPR
jgi:two-component system, OmpR family, response regulator